MKKFFYFLFSSDALLFRVFQSYLLRRIIPVFFAIFLFLAFVLFFAQMLLISNIHTGTGLNFLTGAPAFIFSLPLLWPLMAPLSLLLAIVFVFSQMRERQEFFLLTLCGASHWRIIRFLAFLGFVLALTIASLSFGAEKWAVLNLRHLLAKGAQQALIDGLVPGQFISWQKKLAIFVEEKNNKGHLKRIFLSDFRDRKKPLVMMAQQSVLAPNRDENALSLALTQGVLIHHTANTTDLNLVDFENASYEIQLGGLLSNKAKNLPLIKGLGFHQLRACAAHERNREKRVYCEVVFQQKIALLISTILFIILAFPLSFVFPLHLRSGVYALVLLMCCFYSLLMRFLELEARTFNLAPFWVGWGPNLFLFGFALLVWFLSQRRVIL